MWVNIYLPAKPLRQENWNTALTTVAADYPDSMFILDWATLAAENPNWLANDAIHCSGKGYQHRSTAIAMASRSLIPATPPDPGPYRFGSALDADPDRLIAGDGRPTLVDPANQFARQGLTYGVHERSDIASWRCIVVRSKSTRTLSWSASAADQWTCDDPVRGLDRARTPQSHRRREPVGRGTGDVGAPSTMSGPRSTATWSARTQSMAYDASAEAAAARVRGTGCARRAVRRVVRTCSRLGVRRASLRSMC